MSAVESDSVPHEYRLESCLLLKLCGPSWWQEQPLSFITRGDLVRLLNGWRNCSDVSRLNWRLSHLPTRWRA